MRGVFLGLSILLTVAVSYGYNWSDNPGNGSPENPYQISEPNQLLAINEIDTENLHFILTNDIVFDPNNNPGHVFEDPLIYGFSGTFDGDGKTIYNLRIDVNPHNYNDCPVGLIGSNTAGVIRNVHLRNAKISCVSPLTGVGLLCGTNTGIIGNCSVEGIILANNSSGYTSCLGGLVGSNSDAAISDCSSDTRITIPNNARLVGGFVGTHAQFNNLIQDCTATGTISTGSTCDSVGGFAGANDGAIDNCSADCDITAGSGCYNIGGFAGANFEGLLTDSFSTGSILCLSNSYSIGGLLGAGPGNGPQRGVEGCNSDCDISLPSTGCQNVGGLIGRTYGGICRDCYTTRSYTFNASTCGGLIGLHSGILERSYTTGDVTGGNFVGGLIGKSTNGRIAYCSTRGTIEGPNIVGGLIGWNEDAEIVSCSATGQVIGTDGEFFAGLIAVNKGNIYNSYALGSVSGFIMMGGLVGDSRYASIVNCYAMGDVSGYDRLGGLIGYSYDNTITNCYSVGYTSSTFNQNFGGLIGVDNSSVISHAYFLDTAGPNNGYGTPLDDPNMMIQANFIDWDFVGESANGENEIWRMCVDGVDYPRLSWEFSQNGDYVCPDGTGMEDLQALAQSWLTAADVTPVTFNYACDANGDEIIRLEDFAVLAEHWLEGVAPFLALSETHVFAAVDETGPNPAPISVELSNLARDSCSFTIDYIGGQPAWLDITPTSGSLDGYQQTTLSIAIDVIGPPLLSPDLYEQAVAVMSPEAINSPQIFTVHLTVVDQASYLTATPESCSFEVLAGGPNPTPVSVELENSGYLDSDFTINYPGSQPAWLDVTPTSGTLGPSDNTTLSIAVDVIDPPLPVGSYSATFEILDPESPTSPVEISVALEVTN